ncbi:MAG: 3-phosphoshikimate 1-carboxyvinyltransferase [Methanobacteriota archaeon]|nr:MAG: 3-phosphoshikimate 1-carboxyvinyltransferase [Euryarchaeota archaeon]
MAADMKGHSDGSTIRIEPKTTDSIEWDLAPSKSHMIRWLLLSAISKTTTEIRFNGSPGADIQSMAKCLEHMGVVIVRNPDFWVVEGVGAQDLIAPDAVVNCENSGTALRLLLPYASSFDVPIMVDGDSTLRSRHLPTLTAALIALGAEISHLNEPNSLPCLVKGPLKPSSINLDVSMSSQPLSSILFAMPRISATVDVEIHGSAVSRRHAELSFRIAEETGSSNRWDASMDSIHLESWAPITPNNVQIPGDMSLVSFGLLFARLHGAKLTIPRLPAENEGLGSEILLDLMTSSQHDPLDLDLRDANDLLPPLAAYLAIGPGGRLRNASHARYKESNRIRRTVELLSQFGLKIEEMEDGIQCVGSQSPVEPSSIVDVHGDHRLSMTAICLATKVGGSVGDNGVWGITDPDFLKRVIS